MADNENDDIQTLMGEAVGQACLQAVQALRQSIAVIELLIKKGVLTPEEVAEQMRLTEHLSQSLQNLSERGLRKLDHPDDSH